MPKLLKSLYAQVIIAILIGITIGYFYPDFAVKLKPLGDGFIRDRKSTRLNSSH